MSRENESVEDWKDYILINVGFNKWTGSYSCTALETNRQGAIYAFKHNHGLVIKKGLNLYVVTSNFGITEHQADNLCVKHILGEFKKEDTSDWD